jgi:hypothetical protein
MDPVVHKRFLDYLERARYFAKPGARRLSQEEFTAADAEQRALATKGDSRDDEEEARFAQLSQSLFRD